jgi:hypothetical protein
MVVLGGGLSLMSEVPLQEHHQPPECDQIAFFTSLDLHWSAP